MSVVKIRCVTVGDSGVGKTSLLHRYTDNSFPQGSPPGPLPEKCVVEREEGGTYYQLILVDATEENWRHQWENTWEKHVYFLVCLCGCDATALESTTKWINELKTLSAKFLIVGTKSDQHYIISKEEAERFAKGNGSKFVHCSALTGENIHHVFDEILKLAQSQEDDKTEEKYEERVEEEEGSSEKTTNKKDETINENVESKKNLNTTLTEEPLKDKENQTKPKEEADSVSQETLKISQNNSKPVPSKRERREARTQTDVNASGTTFGKQKSGFSRIFCCCS